MTGTPLPSIEDLKIQLRAAQEVTAAKRDEIRALRRANERLANRHTTTREIVRLLRASINSISDAHGERIRKLEARSFTLEAKLKDVLQQREAARHAFT
jgi:hypothetical protein